MKAMTQETLFGDTDEAGTIYAFYPRKVGRPKALKAIEKALAGHGYEYLLERTRAYADLRRDNQDEFPSVPHPSTWFNQERFNDDPSTWGPRREGVVPVRRENIDVPITRL